VGLKKNNKKILNKKKTPRNIFRLPMASEAKKPTHKEEGNAHFAKKEFDKAYKVTMALFFPPFFCFPFPPSHTLWAFQVRCSSFGLTLYLMLL
jgi:hypothetical protein